MDIKDININGNLAYKPENQWNDNESRAEIIDGKITLMSPRPRVNHIEIAQNINFIFRAYLKDKAYRAYGHGLYLYLTEKDRFIPDGMIVCDRDKIKRDGVHGAPDLVIEILSPGTAKRDRNEKYKAYERAGVREYWIVNPGDKSIEQYILQDKNNYNLYFVSAYYPDWELNEMDPEERADSESIMSFPCGIFPDFIINTREIFADLLF